MPPAATPSFLSADVDWILFGGKGGVGKTTCAAATALHRARHHDFPVRLLSTDPAHSLEDSLGGAESAQDQGEAVQVEEFDAEAALGTFRENHRATLQDIVSKGTLFDDEDIGELLELGLPGMDEVMAFLRLARLLDVPDEAGPVIVDTAPTGHTLRLLDAPELFDTWLDVLDAMLEKHRALRAAFGSGGRDALDDFLDDMKRRARRVLEALRDPARCQFVVVTQAEPLVLAETHRLFSDLRRREVPVADVVVNRLPRTGEGPDLGGTAGRRLRDAEGLADVSLWGLPAYDDDVQGRDRLLRLWTDLEPISSSPAERSPPSTGSSTPRDVPAVLRPVPDPEQRLVFFAGKGGVGKTTLACATALGLADRASNASVLLLSTDPAHSLSAALRCELGDAPTAVGPGLDVLEVDAAARFEALRRDYVEEIRQFFRDTTGANVDLPYDRPVMEGLLDLAPPGIDEVMGWTVAMDRLEEGQYDTCVIDPAPTGHFVRLLETPRLLQDWLRAFFRILRKYRKVVRLPNLKDRLVHLSKQTKRLRSLLRDGDGAVYGVTLPASMAWAETEDLIDHADRLGVEVPVLILNRVARGEGAADAPAAQTLRAFRQRFPGRVHGAVAEGAPPHGVEALQGLGRRLLKD
jgi:arsenite-transporting ATPase